MNINWFTVIAQVINFLLLVWLLKRFLYKPILNAIDEREKKIAAQLKDADDKKTAAEKEQEDFRKKNDAFDQQRKVMMDKMNAEVNAQHDKLLEGVRNDANTLRVNLEKASKDKQEGQNLEIAQKTRDEVFTIAKKALADMASLSLEEQTVNIFIKRLNELKGEEKKKFAEAFQSNSNAILVRSAFDLSAKQQQNINCAVDVALGTKATLQFKPSPSLISGIDLTTNGYKLAWNFSEYLDSLEKSISGKMKEKTQEIPATK